MLAMSRSDDTPTLPLLSHPRERNSFCSKHRSRIVTIGIIAGYCITGTLYYFGEQSTHLQLKGIFFLTGFMVGTITTAVSCCVCFNACCRD